MSPVQVRAADVELLSGSPEGHPVATAARRWAAFDGHTGALHQLKDSSDFVAVQLHGESQICMCLLLQCPIAVRNPASRKCPHFSINQKSLLLSALPCVSPLILCCSVVLAACKTRSVQMTAKIPSVSAAGEARIVTLAPFAEHRGVEVAPVGLTNMLNAGGAVLSFQLADERPRQLRGSQSSSRSGSEDGAGSSSNGSVPARGVAAHLVIRGNGHLLLAASDAPRRVLLDGVPVPYTHDGEAGSVYVELPSANKLTRDVALSF